jgi:hypothetical protein
MSLATWPDLTSRDYERTLSYFRSHSLQALKQTTLFSEQKNWIFASTSQAGTVELYLKGYLRTFGQANRHTPFANRRIKFYARTITETQRARLQEKRLIGGHQPACLMATAESRCHYYCGLPSRAGIWSSRLIKKQWRLPANAASDQRRCSASLCLYITRHSARACTCNCWISRSTLSQIAHQVIAIVDLHAEGAPSRPPSAYRPQRSRVIISTPGCRRSHSAKLVADRTGSRSTTRRRSRSMSMVSYRCGFRQAQSSTPSTRNFPSWGRPEVVFTRRSIVSRLAIIPICCSRLDPGNPPRT